MKVCSVCGGKYHAKGLCRKHYSQLPEQRKRRKEYNSRPEVKERERGKNSRAGNETIFQNYGFKTKFGKKSLEGKE